MQVDRKLLDLVLEALADFVVEAQVGVVVEALADDEVGVLAGVAVEVLAQFVVVAFDDLTMDLI